MLKKLRCSLVSKWPWILSKCPKQNVLVSWFSIWTSHHSCDIETLRNFLHVNDNDSWNNPDDSNNKLFKVRPLLDLVRNNWIKIEPEKSHSIDEQIIPAKTKRSGGVKQYTPKKIHKWDFKNMVRASQSVIVCDFWMHGGEHSARAERCTVEESVLQLVEEIPKNKNYQVFFGNWFSPLPRPWVFYQLQHCALIV